MSEFDSLSGKEIFTLMNKETDLSISIRLITAYALRCMKKNIRLKKENEELKKEVDKLRMHILSSPDGELYFEAKQNYESCIKTNIKNDN